MIDREGKVLDANMTRPSDTKTIEKLTALGTFSKYYKISQLIHT